MFSKGWCGAGRYVLSAAKEGILSGALGIVVLYLMIRWQLVCVGVSVCEYEKAE